MCDFHGIRKWETNGATIMEDKNVHFKEQNVILKRMESNKIFNVFLRCIFLK